ncbi:hypothetical protein EN781_18145 [Mesorhizobium sp. M4A.F.Ca.ET.090.04.2.1]|uniref:hypothetical protein n=1 Tax=Mesorhizobium sp. M4A.F.Ca.ET.090.04.2.1 TaxID=2496663 RepID=UPI000FCCB24C|nr:hypothetical protein [Mesorhizobium sp. M4A.F.Ca.ET.090.04.2.1]RVC43443.1 hypothetical protein EN781_18145 [Mesorhizobium sp. M4A.F.Ca.ET.090.04.2.1]
MSWTDRPENVSQCGGELGPVADDEFVARLLHERNLEPNFDPFPRSEIFGLKGQSNTCGDADGVSLVRCNLLTDDELVARSIALANLRPPRAAAGAHVGAVAAARAIRLEGIPSQAVFIYDDPKQDDKFHAVMRGIEGLSRPVQSDLRREIMRVFNRRVVA